ncbi:MAG: choice-of-anchor D domain-containing protein [Treponema sp.]|jgi:hypothetical protein|nr:choice-of-anchor D domain-containing protein [Treponema sp.]
MKSISKLFFLLTVFVLSFTSCETPTNENNGNNGNNGNNEPVKTGTLFVYAGTNNSLEIKNDSRGYTFPDTILNRSNEITITIKNIGDGTINLLGKPYINLDGATTVFSVSTQPESSTISPDKSISFKIKFSPVNATESYVYVSIPNDSKNEPDFSFTVYGTGVRPKPIASVIFENNVINQNDPIDAGEVFITQSKSVTVVIKNDGTETLTIEKANIAITGADRNAFIKSTDPGENVASGSQTSFFIECKPFKEGINQAILTIPTNDNTRNPIIVNLQVTGKRGTPVMELTQGNEIITNNSLTPVDFERVEIGTSQTLTFTIKNSGPIALELTGTPLVESSNPVFTVSSQPANKTINQGATVSFAIRYTPATEDDVTGRITIANNAGTGEFTFLVKGTGYEKKPQIVIKQDDDIIPPNGQYTYDSLLVGTSTDITFTIENTGDANLSITSVNGKLVNLADNQTGFYSVVLQPSATVSSKGQTTFTVRFAPTAINANVTAHVQIKTDSQTDSDFTFRLNGNGRGYNIGETGPGGGYIFYISGNEFKECTDLPYSGTWNTAKILAANYRGGNFSNWYLPDIGELNLMYNNLHKNGMGNLEDDEYWSSTEYENNPGNVAWFLDFYDGFQFPDFKTSNTQFVCAVRRFTM